MPRSPDLRPLEILRRARVAVVVPAYDAVRTLGAVLDDVADHLPELAGAVCVVDDGSRDGTADVARDRGVHVAAHGRNLGKGAALATGFAWARARGADVALTLDADGQHPAASARELLAASDDPAALVLAVRDLAGEGAPKKNRASNAISNFFLSRFAGRPLADTQCGLRRYPLAATEALRARAAGYDFEAEVLLLALRAEVPVVERRVRVHYPDDRVTHFHNVRDPARIVRTVLRTVLTPPLAARGTRALAP